MSSWIINEHQKEARRLLSRKGRTMSDHESGDEQAQAQGRGDYFRRLNDFWPLGNMFLQRQRYLTVLMPTCSF